MSLMDNIEIVRSLLERANGLPYQDLGELDLLLRQVDMIIRRVFGDSSSYLNNLKDIVFHTAFNDSPEHVHRQYWDRGQRKLVNLIRTMLADVESFGTGQPSLIDVDLPEIDVDRLSIRQQLKALIQELLKDVERAHRAGACIAAVLLYRSIIEAFLLGLLLRRGTRAMDPTGRYVPKDNTGTVRPLENWSLEQLIRRAAILSG
jgi:hypothetical protein